MAIDQLRRSCTIVLHDGRVSHDDVLCGTNVLPKGFLAYLTASSAARLCIVSKTPAQNPDEISIHISLAQRFGFENRTKGAVEIVEDYEASTSTHVELSFRDQHLSRADMWQIKQRLDSTVMYKGQRVYYLGSAVADVDAVYIAGAQVDSAYSVLTRTKLIFRSCSARFTVLIEVSKEMLEYWVDGDVMYERMLSGFLPELFRRWEMEKVRHQISVVLFGRSYKPESAQSISSSSTSQDSTSDWYYVVAADCISASWPHIVRELKRLFNSTTVPRNVCPSAKGSMLEAIHMAGMDFANDRLDPHLDGTGTSIIAITAGAGCFETNHGMLKHTTQLLMGNSIGVDIVALSPKPLHPVPLFAYTRDNIWEYALPHWADISFWRGPTDNFATRWLLPEAGDDFDPVAIPPLSRGRHKNASSVAASMAEHDEELFGGQRTALQATSKTSATHIVGSADTVKVGSLPKPPVEAASTQQPISTEPAKSRRLSNAAKPSVIRAKREGLPPHALMAAGRKISLGPKGLAPGRSMASTSITTEHAQHGKDPAMGSFSPNEGSSGIAKQIRQSLARKPSQQSLNSVSTNDSAEATRPIIIQNGHGDDDVIKSDPTSLIQQHVLNTVSESELAEECGLSETPKAKKDPFYAAVKAAEAEGTWLTSPWLTLLNPCNPKRSNMRVAAQYRKWQHVFPRAISPSEFKWTSMTSPATLPLTTEYRPTLRELERYPSKKVRRLLVLPASDSAPGPQYTLEQLILSRLAHGFQIAINELSVADLESSDRRERILVSLGNTHHELQYLSDAELQIVEYSAETPATSESEADIDDASVYAARIRGTATKKSVLARLNLTSLRSEPDWSGLDDQLISRVFAPSKQGCLKARFVLIPIEPPNDVQSASRGLAEQERHIEGIQKLTQLWQRNRYFTADDQRRHVSLTRTRNTTASRDRDPNPLAVEYQTRDPSAVVNAYGPSLTGQLHEGDLPMQPLFSESEQFHTSTFDVEKLVKQMQESPPRGVEVRDRRWLTRLHFNCFRGDEMVNWLLRVFKDVETRDEAVTIGNELMSRDIFAHVRHKHDFRDGNYFYQITSAHRTTDYPDTVSMFAKGAMRSVPATPTVDVRNSPMLRAIHETDSISSGKPTPDLGPQERKQVLLSQMMLCNVDPAKKSSQVEIVSLHYDRIHNPDNCYHIQLDWLNTTAKLIREAIGRWASLAENYGLRLVQLPLVEAHKLCQHHPFDQPIPVKLAIHPPERILATPVIDPHMTSPRPLADVRAYQKALLRHLDFVLDSEAASSFSTKLDVTYSYGQPDYELTQFIHESGFILAQISGDEESDFLLVPNRLAATKVSASSKATDPTSPAEIIEGFIKFCSDEKALKVFYEQASRPRVVPQSPWTPSPLPPLGMDGDIPPMQLPPRLHLGHRLMMKDML